MRRLSFLALFALAAAAGVLAAVLVAGPAASAEPSEKEVIAVAEQNLDEQGAIRVHEAGVAAVEVKNTPAITIIGTIPVEASPKAPLAVTPVRKPFQQFVEVTSGGPADVACEAIRVPEGMRLTLESFSVHADGVVRPSVYLRTRVSRSGSLLEIVNSIRLDLEQIRRGLWAGDRQTLLFSHDTAPDGHAYAFEACIISALGTSAQLNGLVGGYLEPLG